MQVIKYYIFVSAMNLLAIPSSLSRSYSTFPLCLGTTLIEIAVYITSVLSTLYIYQNNTGIQHKTIFDLIKLFLYSLLYIF